MLETINKYILKPFSDFISGFIDNLTNAYMNNSFYINDNIFSIKGLENKFNSSLKVSNTFIVISLVCCIVSLLYSLDIFSAARLKKIIREFLLAMFIINSFKYLIESVHKLANLFTDLWFPSSSGIDGGFASAIITSIGLGGGPAALETMGSFLLFLVGFVVVLLLLIMLTHNIVEGLIKVLIIILPILVAFYPTEFGKNICKRMSSLYAGLLALAPLQSLVIGLLVDSITEATNPTFSNIMSAIGMLLLTGIVIPGVIVYVITTASSPKLN